jgi:hypothetical protein
MANAKKKSLLEAWDVEEGKGAAVEYKAPRTKKNRGASQSRVPGPWGGQA